MKVQSNMAQIVSAKATTLACAGLALLALTGCSPQDQDQIARAAARKAIHPVVQERFPGVPLEPAVDCFINAASAPQIRALAVDGIAGPTESTVEIVSNIATQPQTLTCLASEGLPAIFSAARP